MAASNPLRVASASSSERLPEALPKRYPHSGSWDLLKMVPKYSSILPFISMVDFIPIEKSKISTDFSNSKHHVP
jgi:hypothetical protein